MQVMPGLCRQKHTQKKTKAGDDIKIVGRLSHFGNVLSTEESTHEDVITEIRFAQKKFRHDLSIFCKKDIY